MDQIMQDDDFEETLVYHSRMQYLKRDGGCTRNCVNGTNSKQRRRMSSMNILDDNLPNLPSLAQEQLQPCSRDILLPPNELMTRTQSFRHAYWEHHFHPTTRNIKQIFPATNERTERLSKKRKEIIAKLQANEKARREAELKRRAERLLAQQSNTKVDSDSDDDSDDEQSNDNIANTIMRSTMVGGTTRKRKDDVLPRQIAKHDQDAAAATTEAETTSGSFNFLSDWANEGKI